MRDEPQTGTYKVQALDRAFAVLDSLGNLIIFLQKIAESAAESYLKENTLITQPFVKDSGKTVARQHLGEVEKGLAVIAFKRVALGLK